MSCGGIGRPSAAAALRTRIGDRSTAAAGSRSAHDSIRCPGDPSPTPKFSTAMSCFSAAAVAARAEVAAAEAATYAESIKARRVASAQKRLETATRRKAQAAYNAALSGRSRRSRAWGEEQPIREILESQRCGTVRGPAPVPNHRPITRSPDLPDLSDLPDLPVLLDLPALLRAGCRNHLEVSDVQLHGSHVHARRFGHGLLFHAGHPVHVHL